MKLRILKDGNGRYIIEKKKCFFSKWKFIDSKSNVQNAKELILDIVKEEIRTKEIKINSNKLTLIEQFNIKDI